MRHATGTKKDDNHDNHDNHDNRYNNQDTRRRMWHCTVAVLGFSLNVVPHPHPHRDAAPATSAQQHRRLQVVNDEPCKSSCDAGEDQECDEQDSQGDWTLSCDLHPTTSCDEDCTYSPPPPLAPWLENGTYPAPPPPPPPPDYFYFGISLTVFVLAVVILVLACVWTAFQGARIGSPGRMWLLYWCCCCVSFDDWERRRQRAAAAARTRLWTPAVQEAQQANSGARTLLDGRSGGSNSRSTPKPNDDDDDDTLPPAPPGYRYELDTDPVTRSKVCRLHLPSLNLR